MRNCFIYISSSLPLLLVEVTLISSFADQAGDKICIFGFSRGAYTARSLAGMIHKVGLLPADNHQQVRSPLVLFLLDNNININVPTLNVIGTFCVQDVHPLRRRWLETKRRVQKSLFDRRQNRICRCMVRLSSPSSPSLPLLTLTPILPHTH